jgi:hypothetical protein
MTPPPTSEASGSRPKPKTAYKSKLEFDAFDVQIRGRPFRTDFSEDPDGSAWELWTWAGPAKGRRMWDRPTILRPVEGTNEREIANQDELVPAFPVSVLPALLLLCHTFRSNTIADLGTGVSNLRL